MNEEDPERDRATQEEVVVEVVVVEEKEEDVRGGGRFLQSLTHSRPPPSPPAASSPECKALVTWTSRPSCIMRCCSLSILALASLMFCAYARVGQIVC